MHVVIIPFLHHLSCLPLPRSLILPILIPALLLSLPLSHLHQSGLTLSLSSPAPSNHTLAYISSYPPPPYIPKSPVLDLTQTPRNEIPTFIKNNCPLYLHSPRPPPIPLPEPPIQTWISLDLDSLSILYDRYEIKCNN